MWYLCVVFLTVVFMVAARAGTPGSYQTRAGNGGWHTETPWASGMEYWLQPCPSPVFVAVEEICILMTWGMLLSLIVRNNSLAFLSFEYFPRWNCLNADIYFPNFYNFHKINLLLHLCFTSDLIFPSYCRASHYFISFMSEASAVAAGFGASQVGSALEVSNTWESLTFFDELSPIHSLIACYFKLYRNFIQRWEKFSDKIIFPPSSEMIISLLSSISKW